MPKEFKAIDPAAVNENFIQLIGYDWMLVTAGNLNDYNTMTASWGGIGYLWNLPVSFIFVRPQRFTYEFTEKFPDYTLSFFSKEYKDVLNFCGTHSGRDVDKADRCNINPVESPGGSVHFSEARLVLKCKKMYFNDIDPANFVDKRLKNIYTRKDYHRLYIGEIKSCLIRE